MIHPPPPQFPIAPTFFSVEPANYLRRIFNPARHGTTASTFRKNGPRLRFDHHRGNGANREPDNDPQRGISYFAFTLMGCLVEVFGDSRIVDPDTYWICRATVLQRLTLLDLRGNGAMGAGSVVALAAHADHAYSQEWSRYFYDNPQLYGLIDGIIYPNAHNGEDSIALYERAAEKLDFPAQYATALRNLGVRLYHGMAQTHLHLNPTG